MYIYFGILYASLQVYVVCILVTKLRGILPLFNFTKLFPLLPNYAFAHVYKKRIN